MLRYLKYIYNVCGGFASAGRKSHLMLLSCLLISTLSFTACTDKDIDWENSTGMGEDMEVEDAVLSFSMFLDQVPSTRAMDVIEKNIDNYIDTTRLQILFIDKEGNFLFQPPTRWMRESPDKNGQWDIYIPLTKSAFGSNSSMLGRIRAALEKDSYRIAILANWVHNKDFYSLDWGWDNSILTPQAPDPKTIHDLHWLKEDTGYSDKQNDGSYKAKSAYQFLMKGTLSGVNTEWVQFRNVTGSGSIQDDEAWHLSYGPDNTPSISDNSFNWIRNNWDPVIDAQTSSAGGSTEHGIYRHYSDLWQLWLFGGSLDNPVVSYESMGVKTESGNYDFAGKWQTRNGNAFATQEWFEDDNHWITANDDGTYKKVDELTFVAPQWTAETDEAKYYMRSFNGSKNNNNKNGYYGLIMPAVPGTAYHSNSTDDNPIIDRSKKDAYNYLSFVVPGTGKLRVVFGSADGKDATLVVQRASKWQASYTVSGNDIKEIGKSSGTVVDFKKDMDTDAGFKVDITQDSDVTLLFCQTGSVIIYAIEYVADEFLSASDREGILPTEDHPIPMYGIQEFPKITTWGSQDILDLLAETGRRVNLIRSVAKVELYLQTGGANITHVYLRSMNRKSRCEPTDVLNNTGDLWKTHATGNNGCEWFNIFDHGPFKKSGNFQDWFGWFFGSWKSLGLDGFPSSFTDSRESPHLYNPDVQRSDFAHFICDKNYQDSKYHRFILYVPDKNVSDPNSVGSMSSSHKVCHIEYRRAGQTDFLDDNDCYRIYFTDYSTNPVIKGITYDKMDDYEKEDNLKYHWPIMRNHIYRFYVGAGNDPQDVRVKVTDFDDSADPKREVW